MSTIVMNAKLIRGFLPEGGFASLHLMVERMKR